MCVCVSGLVLRVCVLYVYICMYRKIKRSKLSFPPPPPIPREGVGVADTLDTIIEKGVTGHIRYKSAAILEEISFL